jgi:hypothetical protein
MERNRRIISNITLERAGTHQRLKETASQIAKTGATIAKTQTLIIRSMDGIDRSKELLRRLNGYEGE